MGKQDDVERLFPKMHVLLMPSEMESFGLGALEGWRAACPGGDARGRIARAGDGGRGRVSGASGRHRAQSRRVVELLDQMKASTVIGGHPPRRRKAPQPAVERFASAAIIPQYEKVL